MIDMLKRHAIQVLRRAGHSQTEIATLAGVSRRSVQRVEGESAVTHIDAARERETRGIGRPAKAEPFRAFVVDVLARDPDFLSVEILRRAKLNGYAGGKTALYDLISALRPTTCARSCASKGSRENSRNTISARSTSAFSMGREPGCASSRRD